VDEGPYVITGVDFENGTINWKTCKHFSKTRFDEDPSIHVKEGDLLITKDGTIGKVAIAVNTPNEVSLNSGVMIIRPQIDLNRNYLRYVLLSKVFWNWYESTQRGNSTIKHLYQDQFYNFKYPMPLLKEQHSIVKRLNDEIPTIEGAINTINEFIKKIDGIIKSRFIEMFGHPGVNEKEWIEKRLGQVAVINDGEHSSPPKVDSGHLYLMARNVTKNHSFDLTNVVFVDNETHSKIYSRCNSEPGDVIMTNTGTIGSTVIMPDLGEVSLDRGLTLIKYDRSVLNNQYLMYYLSSDYVQQIINGGIHKSAIAHFFLAETKKLEILLPPLQLQEAFALFVKQVDKSRFELKVLSEQLVVKLNEFKQSLIYECVTGKTLPPEED
jgi:type I restriction enzyme S subunit